MAINFDKIGLFFAAVITLNATACHNKLPISVNMKSELPVFNIEYKKSIYYCIEGVDVFEKISGKYDWTIYRDNGKCLQLSKIIYGVTPENSYVVRRPIPLRAKIHYILYLHGSNVDGTAEFWFDNNNVKYLHLP